ncbi:MAG: hypothetical protein R3F59_31395 [Myxococcota bacterium]
MAPPDRTAITALVDGLHFPAPRSDAVAEIRARAAQHRLRGPANLRVEVADAVGARSSAGEVASAFVRHLGLTPLDDDDWQPIPRDWAEQVLVRLLSRDLAYRSPLLEPEVAAQLARRFLGLFGPGAVLLSNGDGLTSETDAALGGIGEATFEKGVIAVDGERVGLMWVFDED